MRDYIFFNGKSSADFGVYITDAGIYDSARRSYETVAVPGRNGNVIFENDRYDNVDLQYPAFIIDDFDANYRAFVAFLHSQKGYKRLSESFHPDEFYMATFKDISDLRHTIHKKIGSFRILFERKPQRYLKSGENIIILTGPGAIKNPTLFEALPLIRAYGTGQFTINGVTVRITNADEYTDIDCESQEAYKGNVNCNGNVTLDNGVFPSLVADVNDISMSGITRLEIKSRWWTI